MNMDFSSIGTGNISKAQEESPVKGVLVESNDWLGRKVTKQRIGFCENPAISIKGRVLNDPEKQNLSFYERLFSKKLKIKTESGSLITILVNKNSFFKQLKNLNFEQNELDLAKKDLYSGELSDTTLNNIRLKNAKLNIKNDKELNKQEKQIKDITEFNAEGIFLKIIEKYLPASNQSSYNKFKSDIINNNLPILNKNIDKFKNEICELVVSKNLTKEETDLILNTYIPRFCNHINSSELISSMNMSSVAFFIDEIRNLPEEQKGELKRLDNGDMQNEIIKYSYQMRESGPKVESMEFNSIEVPLLLNLIEKSVAKSMVQFLLKNDSAELKAKLNELIDEGKFDSKDVFYFLTRNENTTQSLDNLSRDKDWIDSKRETMSSDPKVLKIPSNKIHFLAKSPYYNQRLF